MKRKITKRLRALAAAACALMFSACAAITPKVEGDELINKARADYRDLDSAKVIMTNTVTGEVEQVFTFKYDEKDILMYSYQGRSENSEYAQYNNGMECFSYENGEYSHYQKGDRGFDLYTRDVTHPQADEGLILFVPAAVTEATMQEEDGVTHITHIYDPEKIGAQAEKGAVTGFKAEYFFKGDQLLYFIESTESEEDGEKKEYSYKVEITEKNSVGKIENTVDRYKPD